MGWKWKVACGDKANIWEDPWLLDPLCPRILSPNPHENRWTKVGDLLDKERNMWKEDLLELLFIPRDVEQILGIPLSSTGLTDERIWKCTSNGKFSVKSAYVLAKEILNRQQSRVGGGVESSNGSQDEGKWKRIWHMKAPGKVRTFIWKCLHDIVSVNNNLVKKKVPVECLCPICGLWPETVSHTLFNCDRAKRVWLLSPFRFRPEVMDSVQIDELWGAIGKLSGDGDKRDKPGLFSSICWQIWKARNKWVFTREWMNEVQINARGVEEFHEYCQAIKSPEDTLRKQTGANDQRWVPPSPGFLKVNVDGAFDAKTGRGGAGIVIRDEKGQLKGMTAIPLLHVASAEMTEALGFRGALEIISSEDGQKYLVEGDAQGIINMLREASATKSSLDILIRDSIFLAQCFIVLFFSLCFSYL